MQSFPGAEQRLSLTPDDTQDRIPETLPSLRATLLPPGGKVRPGVGGAAHRWPLRCGSHLGPSVDSGITVGKRGRLRRRTELLQLTRVSSAVSVSQRSLVQRARVL